jgi:MFS family permease
MNLKLILAIIVFSQFCCTSLWFAGNAVVADLILGFGLDANALGYLTSAVQLGFIVGTLSFAVLTISDRFSPSKVFFICATLGALFNLGIIWEGNSLISLLLFRFLTGFFLAGIYPVGMKIASDYFDKGLGKSLGYLVGALVLGTALPHLLKDQLSLFPWQTILIVISSVAFLGGLLLFFLVPDGPFQTRGQKTKLSSFLDVFNNKEFKSAAFGYFGHMWELYTFWAFLPLMLTYFNKYHLGFEHDIHNVTQLIVSLWSFIIISIGALSCVFSGYVSQIIGEKKTAFTALMLSGLCCLVFPFVFMIDSKIVFISFLLFWGVVVIADSPVFSTMVAQKASSDMKGTALTIVNCIGFSLTIVSIQSITFLLEITNQSIYVFTILAIGPVFGLFALRRVK